MSSRLGREDVEQLASFRREYVPLYEGAVAQRFNRSLAGWLNKAIVDGKEVERYPFVRME